MVIKVTYARDIYEGHWSLKHTLNNKTQLPCVPCNSRIAELCCKSSFIAIGQYTLVLNVCETNIINTINPVQDTMQQLIKHVLHSNDRKQQLL